MRLRATFGLRVLFERRFQILAAALLAILALSFRAVQLAALMRSPQWGYDVSAYWSAARSLIDDQPLYTLAQLSGPYPPQGQFLYLYPPFLAAVFVPLALLSPQAYQPVAAVWALLGAVVLAVSVLAVSRVERVATDRRTTLLLLAAAFAFPPVIGELVLGNVHLLLLGLLTMGWLGARRRDPMGDVIAGVAVGAAALIKIFPALIVVWFVATGRWRAAAVTVGAVVALAAAILPVTGIAPWLDYPRAILNVSAAADITDALAPTVWLSTLIGFPAARLIVLTVGLVAIAWAARHLTEPASYGVAVSVAVLSAPAVFHHYLAVLVLPMLLALAASERRTWIGAAYLAMWGGQQPALGPLSWLLNRGLPAVGALAVPIGLTIFGRRRKRPGLPGSD